MNAGPGRSPDAARHAPGWFERAIAATRESRFVAVAGCPIHYLRWGDPARPGLMFVPGSGQHAHWYAHVAPLLADQFHVVAIDPAGCGDSGRRDDYSLDLVTREIMAVCADSGMSAATVAPTIVGHSMGGQFAVRAALAHGGALLGVIAIDALRYAVLETDPAARALADGADLPLPAQPVYPDRESIVARFRLQPKPMIDIDAPDIIDHIARHSVRPVAGGWTWKHDVAMMRIMTLGIELKDALHTLPCHAAALYGEHSHLADRNVLEEMAAATHGKVTVFVIPGTTHYPMIDSPFAFVAAVKGVALAWIAGAAAGRRA